MSRSDTHSHITTENMQINLKVGGLTSIFQVCIVHFLVFWWPGKFGLKKGTGGDGPHPWGDIVTFFYCFFIAGFL